MFCCIFRIRAFKSSIGLSISMFCCIFRIRAFKSSIEWAFPSDHVIEKEREFKLIIEFNNLINFDSSIFLPVSIVSNERGSPGQELDSQEVISLMHHILESKLLTDTTKPETSIIFHIMLFHNYKP